ncbi:MAG TPA: helix-turn-helix domain-containing protein [Longimicrobium sp.]|jgi:TetR/AcrR family transcriptional repressor of nem operon|uniref:TetR/AcrR family transcriptional regulator n=1 Tax=Longimicrobium sp. TaxID=2029185 RepID=UPI002ED8EBDD
MPRTREFDPAQAVDSAMELFWTKGYEATSMDDLVRHLGVGRGSLYAVFGSKHALYLRALEHYRATRSGFVVEMLSRDAPVREVVREWLQGGVDMTLTDPERRPCMMVGAASERAGCDPGAGRCVRASAQEIEDALHAALTRAQAAGEVARSKDPRALARFFVVTSQGLSVVARTAGREALRDAVEVALSALD